MFHVTQIPAANWFLFLLTVLGVNERKLAKILVHAELYHPLMKVLPDCLIEAVLTCF